MRRRPLADLADLSGSTHHLSGWRPRGVVCHLEGAAFRRLGRRSRRQASFTQASTPSRGVWGRIVTPPPRLSEIQLNLIRFGIFFPHFG